MPRITKQMKEDMTKAALKHAFRSTAEALVKDRAEFMARLYDSVFPKSIRDRMEALPRGYVHEDDDIKFMFSSETIEVKFNGWYSGGFYGARPEWAKVMDCPESISKRMSETVKSGIAIVLNGADPMTTEFEALQNRSKDLCKKIGEAEVAINVALNQCTTIKSLLKAWPEFEAFAKPYDLPDERRLPVAQTSKLNKLLDLPVDEAVAKANEALESV